MIRRLAILILAATSTACTSVGRLEQGAAVAPGANETIFVLGLRPDNYRVSIFPGKVKNGAFVQNPWLNAVFYGAAERGYVVGKSSSSMPLAITNVRIVASESSIIGGENFTPCGDARTVVFSLPRGRVVYLGDFTFDFRGKGLRIIESADLDAARAHLRIAYPQLADSLERASYQLLPIVQGCSQTITIPVYVPSR